MQTVSSVPTSPEVDRSINMFILSLITRTTVLNESRRDVVVYPTGGEAMWRQLSKFAYRGTARIVRIKSCSNPLLLEEPRNPGLQLSNSSAGQRNAASQ